jgi:hypothetical protein
MVLAMSVVTIFVCWAIWQVFFFTASNWTYNQPLRLQVNMRLNNQNRRINNKVNDGKMTKA